MQTKSFVGKYGDILERYLEESDHLVIIVLDSRFCIKEYNAAFARLMPKRDSLTGRDIRAFLLPENQNVLSLQDSDFAAKSKLNFVLDGSVPAPIDCRIFRLEEEYLIFGGRLMLTNNEMLQRMSRLNNELVNVSRDLQRKHAALEEAHSEIKILSGIIPICMHCKKIRDDAGYWDKLEKFISENSEAEFSHGICPSCLDKHYPE